MHFRTLAVAGLASVAAGQTLTDALADQPSLSNLTTYLNVYPDLLSQLDGMDNITVLAPNNQAFAAATNSETGAAFATNDTDTITALFSYHVLQGAYPSFDTMPEFVPTALMDQAMFANVTDGQVVEAVADSDMANATVTFTSGLLQNSSVVSSVNFTGGIIHVIDTFLTVPSNISDTLVQLDLRSAYGALKQAGLSNSVDSMTDVTCFVPNNEAFQAIGAVLATSSPQDIARILQYHVVNGTVDYSNLLPNGTMLTTLAGPDILVTEVDGVLFANSARVLTPNVLVANGVVHVIDVVLNPGNRTATPDPSASTQEPAFGGATSASSAPFTGGVPTATASVTTGSMGSATGASASSSGGAMPMKTGAVGAAALFGAAAGIMNM